MDAAFEPKGKAAFQVFALAVLAAAGAYLVVSPNTPSAECEQACGASYAIAKKGQCYCDETKRVPTGMEGRR